MFQVSAGLPERHLPHWQRHAAARFGTFADGRIDYTTADTAPIIICAVTHQDDILLLKRAHHLAGARGYWSVISGFVDAPLSIKRHVQIELEEELSLFIPRADIRVGESFFVQYGPNTQSQYIWPAHVDFDHKPTVRLDDEHTDYTWVKRHELERYHVYADLPYLIDQTLALA